MNFEEFKLVIETIKIEKPLWFELDSDSLLDNIQIKELEDYYQLELPIEYKQFLKEYGGGYFAFIVIFSGDKNSDWYIIKKNNELGLLKTYNFLAISDSETGDFYGFKVNNNKCETRISVYLHEENNVKETKYEDFYQYVIKLGLQK